MPSGSIDREEFEQLVRPLIGLEVSLPWKGCGTAIFLELGALTPASYHRRDGSRGHDNGEAHIGIEWDWRVEEETTVAYGSSDSRPEMAAGITTLQGSRVISLSITEGVPELRMGFSNGRRLRTTVMTKGDPQWTIRLPDMRWLHAVAGRVILNHGEARGMTAEGRAEVEYSEKVAARWGIPRLEPAPGCCSACTDFVRLDGDFGLLDYGCCTAAGSPFEGRAVHAKSSCPEFQG